MTNRYPTDPVNGLKADLTSTDNMILDDVALENAGVTTTDEFVLGQTLAGVELKLEATSGHTAVADIVVSIQTASASGGSFAEIATFTIPATTVVANEDELVRYVMPKELTGKIFTKVTITTTDDESPLKVALFPVWIP